METHKISVDEKHCKACGICIGLCPKGVLGENYLGKAIVNNPDQCTGCKICEIHCPDFCIEVGAV